MRCFAAFFLFLITVYAMLFAIPYTALILPVFILILTIALAIAVAYFKPYKENWCNAWSSFVLISMGTGLVLYLLSIYIICLLCVSHLYFLHGIHDISGSCDGSSHSSTRRPQEVEAAHLLLVVRNLCHTDCSTVTGHCHCSQTVWSMLNKSPLSCKR